tara:strand:+ start:1513 stop:1794 length:282 start_codon:yes stop_codon:yes gene_type:complete
MKLKLKLNQIVLALAIVVVVYWIYRRRRVELLEGDELKKSEAMLYLETTDTPNAFILYGMVKKQTDDEEKQKKVLVLASEEKWDEVKEFIKTI